MSDTPSLYEAVGGAEGVERLVTGFYDHMETDADVKPIRLLHPKNLKTSREKLYLFLSGWLGGPSLYIEKYGHPRLRARHLPFSIGESERDQWLTCMDRAMHDLNYPPEIKKILLDSFFKIADFMRNKAG